MIGSTWVRILNFILPVVIVAMSACQPTGTQTGIWRVGGLSNEFLGGEIVTKVYGGRRFLSGDEELMTIVFIHERLDQLPRGLSATASSIGHMTEIFLTNTHRPNPQTHQVISFDRRLGQLTHDDFFAKFEPGIRLTVRLDEEFRVASISLSDGE